MTINETSRLEASECRKRFESIPKASTKGNSSSKLDKLRAAARKRIELIKEAKEIGCDVDDLLF